MGKKVPVIVLTVVATLLLGACRTAPVFNVEAQPIAISGSSHTADDVRKAILRAGSRRGWVFSDEGPGKLVGTLSLRKHQATVDVTYGKDSYDITYRDSRNLNYDSAKNKIHSNYNGWVQNLVKDISIEMSLL